MATRNISQHGTLGREATRLRVYTHLYLSIGGMEPIAKIGPAATKKYQHVTLVSKRAMAIRSIPQHGRWDASQQSSDSSM